MFSKPNSPPSILTGSRLQQKENFLAEARKNSPPAGGRVIIAHLGRRLRASGSVIDLSQLPSPSPSGSYHLGHSDSALTIRVKN